MTNNVVIANVVKQSRRIKNMDCFTTFAVTKNGVVMRWSLEAKRGNPGFHWEMKHGLLHYVRNDDVDGHFLQPALLKPVSELLDTYRLCKRSNDLGFGYVFGLKDHRKYIAQRISVMSV